MQVNKKQGNFALRVFNPVASQAKLYVEPANRPTSLNDKTIGLVWNGKPGGDHALRVVSEFIKKDFEGTTFKEFFFGSFPFRAFQLDKVAAECDVVIGASGD